jgi:hypothetical protein
MSTGYSTKHNQTRKRQIDGLENFLSGAFAPVVPSSDFVNHLGQRLSNYPDLIPEAPSAPIQIWRYTILAIGSILGGGLLLALLIRGLINFVATLKQFRQSNRRTDPESVIFSKAKLNRWLRIA